ncbi:MAG: 4-hydroxy-3-methylbut-2-enyl diphosphate reductase [Alphaproteobacteria bacterium MarineAlpha3_Bin7]|nr:MAG: 4-hydroxy-3-methylbut-2-enyl diphosphate reductase [Alphaproteobacteria bacterium MarineAlpha3_Bin7]
MTNNNNPIDVFLAQPRGFCAGVDRAIAIVEEALRIHGAPVYVRHEIVHNKRVINMLEDKGAIFVEEVEDIPDGAITIFSAHGISSKVENDAIARSLPVIDATCPLVSKVHAEGRKHRENGCEVILIGHKGHPEVEGTMGRINGTVYLVSNITDAKTILVENPNKLAYVTQTTLSVDDTRDIILELERRFPKITGPDVKDICYATQNRQSAVRKLTQQVDLLIVLGASNSSNSNRLKEIGIELGVPSYLIDEADQMEPCWLNGVSKIGITAGASAPEELVEELIENLRAIREINVKTFGDTIEDVIFKLPKELTEISSQTKEIL